MAEMTFWDHLDELRKVLFRVIGVWFVLAIGYFIAMPYLFDHVILAPCHNDFIFYDLLRHIGQALDLTDDFFTQEFQVKLVNINLAAPFFIHMSTAFWMSVVTAMPYLFFEVWRFIGPALYPNEKKGVRKALTVGTVMFFVGVLLGYFMVYPLTLRFLSTYQLSAEVENILSLNSYIDNFMMLVLCMGLAFELPLVTWLLSLLGIVNKSFLRKYRRHAIVIIVIAAAIITPTGDPFTLSVVAIPLYLLYEMSILMIKDKKKTDNGKIQQWNEQIESITQQIEDLDRSMMETLAGTDVKTAIDEFADALVDAYCKGEDAAEALGEKTKEVLKKAVVEALKREFLAKGINDAVLYLGESMKDGKLTDVEKREFERMVNAAGDLFNSALEGIGDWIKDVEEETVQQDPLTGAVTSMSEETGGVIAGRLNAFVINQSDQTSIMRQALVYQAEIAANTKLSASELTEIKTTLKRIENKDSSLLSQGIA